MTRWRNTVWRGLVLLLAAAASLIVASPAHAEITCDDRIEWYHTKYEVTATNVVQCSSSTQQIVAVITIYRPVYRSYGAGCTYVSSCRGVTSVANRSSLEQYCAEASGSYMWREGNPALDSRALPIRRSCITA